LIFTSININYIISKKKVKISIKISKETKLCEGIFFLKKSQRQKKSYEGK